MSANARLYTVQKLLAGKLSVMPHPHGGSELADEIKTLYYAGVDVLVSLLMPDEVDTLNLGREAEYCQREGIVYLTYPVVDQGAPPFSQETFALLEQLKTYLARRKHVAVHCWMGLGRSPLIAASVLVISGYTPDAASALLSSARGYTVPHREEQRLWIEMLLQEYNYTL